MCAQPVSSKVLSDNSFDNQDQKYPGKKAILKHVSGNWEYCEEGRHEWRYLKFESDTEDSLLQEFKIWEYRCSKIHDDSIHIFIQLREGSKKVRQYFRQFGISVDKSICSYHGVYPFSQVWQLQSHITVISIHNEFPKSSITKMERIIQTQFERILEDQILIKDHIPFVRLL